ncbi:hypothetical protein DV495_004446 [Geotrichum candidum]|uniref:Similar to Saccharomyces cerevisiae YNR017W TIM23 Essential component of the Translocase of the Inner Mitochondrial membrane (TIM23 complex) n=1 Tax=Geotrichum candidum TaxID=1173061 RepID=A0A0J9XAF0_GEOCN|nr:hypothetical protein DV452_002905 [Geotrichum candidum]KAI9213226.1 hypothetical protein DS838_001870 [Geotrichum bryndzae]KAF5119099.1 hypothetical protein DV454_000201 [Geotrichum candidum]KAF5120771.1 hypothetical protein DV495_004446 [Geotrichum candidum]KAF7499634.1 hypothetical protein DV113_002310 [Geotrichum candidum]
MSWIFGGKQEEAQKPTQEVTFAFDPASVQDVSSFLSAPIDAAKLHPLAGLDKGLEYLNIEDESVTNMPGAHGIIPIKDWTDDLCYGTGAVYLTGLTVGGAYGLAEGLRNSPANASFKLRLNGILNAITRRGPFLGNSAGVLTLVYNGINSGIGYYRGEHDYMNSLAAGALSGALFKCTKGVKPMLIASGLMTTAAGLWCGLKRAVFE